ncbi:hypothetical protein ABIC83_005597 [Roseateles asaccharophilus]|uniref:Uncharacterized protein n=1 Tax=Roseateles asaccharophilus TaxID=582607 RepID=A0ABU2AEP1_9BURK|nr:hypothetical protein [Roseateles asaccharophilus]
MAADPFPGWFGEATTPMLRPGPHDVCVTNFDISCAGRAQKQE